MATYLIDVQYRVTKTIEVQASAPSVALDMASNGEGEWIDDSEEILDTLDPSLWSIWSEQGDPIENPHA